MNERYPLAASLAAISLLTGCNNTPPLGGTEPHEAPAHEQAIDRCYDAPQPAIGLTKLNATPDLPSAPSIPTRHHDEADADFQTRLDAWDAASNAWLLKFNKQAAEMTEAPVYDVPIDGGIAQGDPRTPSPGVQAKTANALVEVTTDGVKGTGFITTERGHQVVITAAHVIGTLAAHDITLTTQDGRHMQPTGGCYLYENEGEFITLTNDDAPNSSVVDTDVAVLTLPGDLTAQPLGFAAQNPQPGSWLNFINYQHFNGPVDGQFAEDKFTNPASYTGIIAPGQLGSLSLTAITGVSKGATRLLSGASGGPVVDGHANVVGISVSATMDEVTMTPDELQQEDSIQFIVDALDPSHGYHPAAVSIVPFAKLRVAMNSSKLKLGSGQ